MYGHIYSKSMLIHPRQREGQESWENMIYRAYCLNSVELGETQRDVPPKAHVGLKSVKGQIILTKRGYYIRTV